MDAREQLVYQRNLLKIEKEEDYRQYQDKILNTSIQERKKEGVCWYPVQLQSHRTGTGDRMVVQVERSIDDDSSHVFQVGSVVSLFICNSSSDRAQFIGGVISYLRKHVMKIVLNSHNLPDWIFEGKIGIDLMFDEATYREMDRALELMINAKEGRASELRSVFYGESKAHIKSGHIYQLPQLNSKQNEALSNIFNSEDLSIIHGPPGTGKTTTLVQAIKETVNLEKQVLVCAPSNTAVDLLVEKLSDEHLDVLRLGHPARVSGNAVEKSLDHRISAHPQYKQLKALRKKAQELKELGFKYKRNFGQAEKRQRKLLLDESKNVRLEADHTEHYITSDLINNASVIACTLVNGNHKLVRSREFKTVFIDEASQGLEAACWIPIMKAHKVVLAGDHFQLPPTIKSIKAAKDGLEVTLFERGISNQDVDVMLQEQYRMHPVIMEFSSRVFYKNKLVAAQLVLQSSVFDTNQLEFIDTAGCSFEEKLDQKSLSRFNNSEAELLVKYLGDFIATHHDILVDGSKRIGVIAPYKAQIKLLRELMDNQHFEASRPFVDTNTVDAFQGQERDVIFISLVRSNAQGEIGFLNEVRRLNVAITRAKSKVVIIGDSATVGKYEFFEKLLLYVQEVGGYRSAFELIDIE